MKFAVSIILGIIALISILNFLPLSFGVTPAIVQQACNAGDVASFVNVTATLGSHWSSGDVGNIVVATVTLYGNAIAVVNSVNVTDNVNHVKYTLQIRSVDQSNSLFVGEFNISITSFNIGVFPQISAIMKVTANAVQHVTICAYEIQGVAGDTITKSTIEGGSLPLVTGTSGEFTFSGFAGNAGAGCIGFSGTQDIGAPSICQSAIGRGVGSYSGLTSIAFVEEADMSFAIVTITSTITGWLFPNFALSGNNGNNTSWILFMFVILLPVGIMDGALLTQTNVDRNAIIFVTLLGLTIGSIMGTMMNFVPFAVPFVFGAVFVIYMWKGRG